MSGGKFYFVGNIDGLILEDAPGVYEHERANASAERLDLDHRYGPPLILRGGEIVIAQLGGSLVGLYSTSLCIPPRSLGVNMTLDEAMKLAGCIDRSREERDAAIRNSWVGISRGRI